MKLVGLTLFGVGYVLGSKAGRERYEQIRVLAGRQPIGLRIPTPSLG